MKNKETMTAFELYEKVAIATIPLEQVISLLNLLIETYHLDKRELTDDDKFDLCAGADTLGKLLDLSRDILATMNADIEDLASQAKKESSLPDPTASAN